MSKNRNRKNNVAIKIFGLITVTSLLCVYVDTMLGNGLFQNFVMNFLSGDIIKDEASMVQRESINFENGMDYEAATFGSAFALSTKDGVKYYNEVGDQRWSDTYNMVSPKMVSEGNWIVIGDLSGNSLRVYNNSGFKFEIQGRGTVMQFALNENGYVSLITQENGRFGVYVYNDKGVLVKERVEENIGVYPLCSDISSDNRSFAVSYIDTTDIVPVSRVLFFYINQQDSLEYTDSIFSASVEKVDEVIGKIHYLKGDLLAVISDKSVYGINKDGIEEWALPLGNMVDQCDMHYNEYIVLAMGSERASISNSDDAQIFDKNSVVWIDTNGKIRAEYKSDEPIQHITSHASGVVIGNNNNFYGLSHQGKVAWEYKGTADIYDCIPMLTLRDVMVMTKQEVVILQMDRVGQGVTDPLVKIDGNEIKVEDEYEVDDDYYVNEDSGYTSDNNNEYDNQDEEVEGTDEIVEGMEEVEEVEETEGAEEE